ncbi:helix-turn-helix domain-containing protein [Isoptericola sp. NPDC055881]
MPPAARADDLPPADRPLPGRLREARANDTAVLAAAREVFAAQGPGASMADVARHAGVGVGSVYRRYPTKEALVEALHVQGVRDAARLAADVADDVVSASEAAADGTFDGGGAVGAFLTRQITGATGPLLRPTGAGGPLPADLAAASEDLGAGLERLVAHDRAAGLLPDGFTSADVMQLLLHLRPSLPFPRAEADALHLRYLALVLAGLRARTRDGDSLGDGPRWDEWVGAWHD